MVTTHLVESSSIRAILYDEAAEELSIEFHSSADLTLILKFRGRFIGSWKRPDRRASTSI